MSERAERSFPDLVERQKADAAALFEELLKQDVHFGGNLFIKVDLPGWENVRFFSKGPFWNFKEFGSPDGIIEGMYGVQRERGMIKVDGETIVSMIEQKANYEQTFGVNSSIESPVTQGETMIFGQIPDTESLWKRDYEYSLRFSRNKRDALTKNVNSQARILDDVKSRTNLTPQS